MLTESPYREYFRIGKSEGHRGHRKVNYEIIQGLVMIDLYVKFNMHSSKAKQVLC